MINGESAIGRGQVQTGVKGASCVDGLSVRYYGDGKKNGAPTGLRGKRSGGGSRRCGTSGGEIDDSRRGLVRRVRVCRSEFNEVPGGRNENLVSSVSIIRDVDMATETAEHTWNQIRAQSATAMLTQANQMPKTVLQLLG